MDAPSTGLPRPAATVADARRWAREHWGVAGEGVELGSQQDRNVLLTTSAGERLLLKVGNAAFPRAEVEAQNAVMEALAAAGHTVPRPLPARNGALIVEVEIAGATHAVRLLTFVPGAPLVDRERLAPATAARIGRLVGRVSAALADLDLPGLERDLQWDLRRGEEVVRARLPHVRDPERR
ncbi:phosphotransferase, partial [Patulibacter sp. S7RM1-6]